MLLALPKPISSDAHQMLRRQAQLCGIAYVCRKLVAIVLSRQRGTHREVDRTLHLPRVKALIDHHPRSAFKYLRKYLARSLAPCERALALCHHYRYLNDRINGTFLARICAGMVVLWERTSGDHHYEIGLSYPKNEEGELFLSFLEDGVVAFTLAFTIAPGGMFDLTDESVIFIGRLQGVADQRSALKRASHLFHEVAPATLLLDTVRAIAQTLAIHGMVGVSAVNQVCLRDRSRANATTMYDEFWISAGASPIREIGYYMPAVREEKPLSSVKNKYRSRIKRKHAFREQLTEEVAASFLDQCLARHAARAT